MLKLGDTGSKVRDLQFLLRIDIDGIFGPAVEQAVIEFQNANGLDSDGVVGDATLSLLKNQNSTQSKGFDLRATPPFNPIFDPSISVNTAVLSNGILLVFTSIDPTDKELGVITTVYKPTITQTNEEGFEEINEFTNFIRARIEDSTLLGVLESSYQKLYRTDNSLSPDVKQNLVTIASLSNFDNPIPPPNPIDLRSKREKYWDNVRSTIQQIKDSHIPPKAVNENTPEDQKPERLQKLGKLILNQSIKLAKSWIPNIQALITQYAVSKFLEELNDPNNDSSKIKEKYCPKREELDSLIKQRNNLLDVLNSIGSTLEVYTQGVNFSAKFAEILQTLASGLTGSKFILNQAAKLIPLIPGAVVSAVNDLGTIADAVVFGPDGTPIIPTIKRIATTVSAPFAITQDTIFMCVNLLSILDELILNCDPDATLPPTSDTINTIFATQLIAGNTDTGNTYKGFILEIETRAYTPKVNQNRAVGKNNSGIVMIATDYSFASDPNVLIDELKFIIDKDNLKAY